MELHKAAQNTELYGNLLRLSLQNNLYSDHFHFNRLASPITLQSLAFHSTLGEECNSYYHINQQIKALKVEGTFEFLMNNY